MAGITAVASRRALSAGTLLVFGGGLALYQMTSLVLGPAGSRELHLSLTIPAVELEESFEPRTSSVDLALGTLAGPGPATSVSGASTTPHRATGTYKAPRAAAPAAPEPVRSQPPTVHPSGHPVPPIVRQPDPQVGAPEVDNAD